MSEQDLTDQLRRTRIEDMLVSLLFSVSSLAYRRLGATADTAEERDLDQVRLAIDTMDALTGVLEKVAPTQLVSDLRSSSSGLKLAYAQVLSQAPAAGAAAPAGEPGGAAAAPEAEPSAAQPAATDAPAADPSAPDPDASDR